MRWSGSIRNQFIKNMDVIPLICIGILSRLLPHPANMTPVGAMALFTGAKFGMKKALIITLATMLITDVFLGFHPVMWATYGSFILAIVIGWSIAKRQTVRNIAGAAIASSLLFFIVTNFAVWTIPGSMYPKTWAGLLDCYIMALPFFRNSLIGDMCYTAVFFGGYELATFLHTRVIPSRRT